MIRKTKVPHFSSLIQAFTKFYACFLKNLLKMHKGFGNPCITI